MKLKVEEIELKARGRYAREFVVRGTTEPKEVLDAVGRLIHEGDLHPWLNGFTAKKPQITSRSANARWLVHVFYEDPKAKGL